MLPATHVHRGLVISGQFVFIPVEVKRELAAGKAVSLSSGNSRGRGRNDRDERRNEMELGTYPFNTKFVLAVGRETGIIRVRSGLFHLEEPAERMHRNERLEARLAFPLSASKLPSESLRTDRGTYIPTRLRDRKKEGSERGGNGGRYVP